MTKSAEKQREYKARLYAAGYKQVQLWVLRDRDKRPVRMDRKAFMHKVDELTAGWKKWELSGLFVELIQIIAVMATKFVPFLRERGVRVFEEVTVETLSDFQDSLLARGLKPQSVNNDLKAVRKAFRYLARKGMIKGNPCPGLQSVTVLRKDQTVRGCYEVKDLKGVFDAPWEDEGAYPLNLLVYTTGMRNGEIRRMRTGDIVERGGCHFIDIRESKTPSGVRLVPLHERVRERLLSYARDKSPDEAVFPCCKSSPMFGKAAVMLGQRLGVSEEELAARHITFYSGRHFWKTLMNCGGLGEEAEEFFMGHKVSGDAAKRYNHRDRQGKDLMARKAGKAFAILDKHLFGS
ncbi:MAG: site-specific tyrosine recombinase XerD [Treponematales bacterium]